MKQFPAQKASLIGGAAMLLAAAIASGQTVVEQWTFDSPSNGTGINSTIIDTWAATATGNSDLGGGVLRYENTDDSNWGNSQLLPDIDTSAIATMTWTIQLADLKVSAGSNFRFSTLTTGGGEIRPEIELTSWGAGPTFSPDMEYNGNTDALSGPDANVALNPDATLGGPLTIVTTWDFVNNTMTMQVGSNPVMSITPAANMADTIGTITGFRMYPRNIVAGDYLDLDTVTIETTPIEGPSPLLLAVALNGGNLDFSWNSQSGLVYDLVASSDLAGDPLSWTPVPVQTGIPADASGTTTTSIPRPPEPRTFYAVIERQP